MKKVIIKDKRKINYVIDPRIELLSIIQILAGEIKTAYYHESEYSNKIFNKYKQYINHQVVLKFKKYLSEGFYIGNQFILQYSNNPFLETQSNDKKCLEFQKLLIKFVKDIEFEKFYLENANYYKKIIENNLNYINVKHNYLSDLKAYYQTSDITINIIFKLIQSDWGEFVLENNEFNNICGIIEEKETPIFVDDNNERSLIFHECSHFFVTNSFKNENEFFVETEDIFFKVDENSVARLNYPYYNMYFEESIVRSITLCLSFKNGYITEQDYLKAIKDGIDLGFIFTKDFCDITLNNTYLKAISKIKRFIKNYNKI